MHNAVRCSAILSCLVLAQVARATDAEEVPPDKLPPKVLEHLRTWSKGAEVVAATREREDDKECFRVTVIDKGTKSDVYVAPDGKFSGRIEDEFAAKDIPELLFWSFIVSVFPGAIGAVAARLVIVVIQKVRPEKRFVLLEWFAAWFGAALVCGMVLSVVARVGLKDMSLDVLVCSVVGGVSASIVDVVALAIQSFRGRRNASRVWIFAFCLIGAAFLCLSIPVANLSTQRRNQYSKAHALKPVTAEKVPGEQ